MIVRTIYKGFKNQYIQFAKGKNFGIFSAIFDFGTFLVYIVQPFLFSFWSVSAESCLRWAQEQAME